MHPALPPRRHSKLAIQGWMRAERSAVATGSLRRQKGRNGRQESAGLPDDVAGDGEPGRPKAQRPTVHRMSSLRRRACPASRFVISVLSRSTAARLCWKCSTPGCAQAQRCGSKVRRPPPGEFPDGGNSPDQRRPHGGILRHRLPGIVNKVLAPPTAHARELRPPLSMNKAAAVPRVSGLTTPATARERTETWPPSGLEHQWS